MLPSNILVKREKRNYQELGDHQRVRTKGGASLLGPATERYM